MSKPRILLITDVLGWGGHQRGIQIKKHLSDEFDFDLITQADFIGKKYDNYDLYYPLFHVMLRNKKIQRMKNRVVTVVTGRTAFRREGLRRKLAPFGNGNAMQGFLNLTECCKAVFANNMIAFRELKEVYNGESYYVPRGVDEELFSLAPPAGGPLKACFVGKGRMPEKGFHNYMVPACRKAGVPLISNIRNYRNAVSQKKVKQDVYDKSHVLLVASTADGTPNPALEAASCGRTILSNPIGNMPEFIENGVNGFLLPKLGMSLYVEKLNWMKKNLDKVIQMGIEARKTVEKDWTWEVVLNRYERVALKGALGL
jgi:glycosyltransferase involved in cell wall biosynthesis